MESTPGVVSLLDVEPELAWRLRDDDRAEARERVTLHTMLIPEGPWSPERGRGHPAGVIVLDGVLLQEVALGGRPSLQLLGPGDVLLPTSPVPGALGAELRWTAGAPTQVAILDDRLQGPFALWPGLALGLLDRATAQLNRLAVQSAIGQLPRVEDRIEATLWELADRWGRVTPNGIHIPLQLTHEMLGRLVGARRPTITLALGTLAERGVLERSPSGGWLLPGDRPSIAASGAAAPPVVVQRLDRGQPPIQWDPPNRWKPEVRDELLATARRTVLDTHRAGEELQASRRRFEETRRRSRALREAAASERAAAGVTPRRFVIPRPAGPSGG